MKITFDPIKNEANLTKHGIAISNADLIEWDTLITKEDNRRYYGEKRKVGLAFITDRGEDRRIISLRKANDREKSYYVLNN